MTASTRPEPTTPSGVSFEQHHSGVILMKVWPERLSEDCIPQEFLLEPEQYLDMMRGLANVVGTAMARTVGDIKQGDCETCQNLRLVERERPGGRTERVHCPDCLMPEGGTFARPRLGGGVR